MPLDENQVEPRHVGSHFISFHLISVHLPVLQPVAAFVRTSLRPVPRGKADETDQARGFKGNLCKRLDKLGKVET